MNEKRWNDRIEELEDVVRDEKEMDISIAGKLE
jgi:hypothetical protein